MISRARSGHLAIVGWVLAALLAPAACSSNSDKPDPVVFSTGSLCPQDRSLTYDSFAREFFASFCTRCHGSDKVGMTARNGAPGDHNFDTLAGVQRWLPNIDLMAAAGPKAVHTDMPLDPPDPSEEQRRKLGAWLACREGL